MSHQSLTPTSANIVWHTPELLTSIIRYLKPTRAVDLVDRVDQSWCTDVARLMRTSRTGLGAGAAVLYESEAIFPGSLFGRSDMKKYLTRQRASASRIKFYLSYVKLLNSIPERSAFDSGPDSASCWTTFDTLNSWLAERTLVLPSLVVVHVRCDSATFAFSRKDTSSDFGEYSVVGVACSGSTLPEMCQKVSKELGGAEDAIQATSIKVCQPSPILFGDRSPPSTADLDRWFSTTKSPETYSYVTSLDLSSVPVKWKMLGDLLPCAISLQKLIAHVENPGIPSDYSQKDITFPDTITNIDINLSWCEFPQLPSLVYRLKGLRTLTVDLKESRRHRGHITNPWDKELGITCLSIFGKGMTHNYLMGIISKCPSLDILRAEYRPDNKLWLTEIEKVYLACPNLWKLSLAFQSPKVTYPFSLIDILTSKLPNLIDLSVPTFLPPLCDLPKSLTGPETKGPRWPRLDRLELGLFAEDLARNRPKCLISAPWLARCVRVDAELAGTIRTAGLLEDFGGGKKARWEQWWRDTAALVEVCRKDLKWVGQVEPTTPGWRILDKVDVAPENPIRQVDSVLQKSSSSPAKANHVSTASLPPQEEPADRFPPVLHHPSPDEDTSGPGGCATA